MLNTNKAHTVQPHVLKKCQAQNRQTKTWPHESISHHTVHLRLPHFQKEKLRFSIELHIHCIKGRVGTFEKPARDTLFVIFHGMFLTSR